VLLNPASEGERSLGKIDVLELDAGDTVQFETAGGGGFGDPFQRDPSLVLADVRAGLVSREQATCEYGVTLAGDSVDEAGTNRFRAQPRAARPAVDFGPERLAYEQAFTDEVANEIVKLLAAFPTRLRPVLATRLRAQIAGRTAAPSLAELSFLLDSLVGQLGLQKLDPAPATA
jgi:N-methylhydantoinase B